MKEFSNLAVGGIKKIFESDGPYVSTSLPLVMREKDSIFLDMSKNDETRTIKDYWEVDINGIKIIFELFFEIYNPKRFFSVISRDTLKEDHLKNQALFF